MAGAPNAISRLITLCVRDMRKRSLRQQVRVYRSNDVVVLFTPMLTIFIVFALTSLKMFVVVISHNAWTFKRNHIVFLVNHRINDLSYTPLPDDPVIFIKFNVI